MAHKLVCTHPLHGYAKGQEITDPDHIAALSEHQLRHFIRVAVDEPAPEAEAEAEAEAPGEPEAAPEPHDLQAE